MAHLFEITAKEIESLDPKPFADVINRLLRAESNRVGSPPLNVQTSLDIYEPDGGVDALVKQAPANNRWLPQGMSVWQFKSGKESHGPADLITEFNKPGVQEVLKDGGAYCVVIGDDLNKRTRHSREKTLQQCCIAAQIPVERCRILNASDVAQWASEHPAITMLPYFSRPTGDWMRWDKWADIGNFKQQFVPDQQRQDIIAFALKALSGQNDILHVRIEGQAGVGKTRLALELFKPQNQETPHLDGFSERMFYLQRPSDIPVGFWMWLESNMNTELVLVIDECDQIDAERLAQQAQRCDNRIRLLTIGLAQEARTALNRSPNRLLLKTLSDEAMRELLQTASRLPMEQVNFVVRLASGFVKLATAIAAALERDSKKIPTVTQLSSATDITRYSEVQDVLHKYLLPKNMDFKAMQAVALLSRVGWEKEFAQEGKAVCDFLGIHWQEAERSIRRQVNNGLVSLQGRYRYVTPHLLAVWLAAEAWATHSDLINLLDILPTRHSRRAFLERLRDLGDNDSARQVVETLLGPTGSFLDLDSISEETRSEVLALLAEAYPLAGLHALQRLLENLPRDELLHLTRGRQNIVGALAKLAWGTETFFGAARLLLALAEAENQQWANNATGTWLELFQTYFGGTLVPALDRHKLIAEALESSSIERQLLAVRAINSALSLDESQSVDIAPQGVRIVSPQWQPATRQDDQAVRQSAVDLLDQALAHTTAEVRQAAGSVLVANVWQFITLGLTHTLLDRLEALPIENDEQRHVLREVYERRKLWENASLTPRQRQRVQDFRAKLTGNSFHDRLRRWVGKWTRGDWQASQEYALGEGERNIHALAAEAVANPELLRSELDWLFSDKAENSMLFVRWLGCVDTAQKWWSEFDRRTASKFGHNLVAAYMQGQVNADRHEWWNAILDEWMENAQKSEAVLNAIWLGRPDDKGLERLVQLVQRGFLAPEKLRVLVWGGHTKSFSATMFRLLIDCILEDAKVEAASAAVDLLEQRLDFFPEETKTLEEVAWNALEKSIQPFSDTMAEYDWDMLAKRYVAFDPVRMARLLLIQFKIEAHNNYIRTSERIEIFQAATQLAPAEVWVEVASCLLKRDRFASILRLALQDWYAEAVGTVILLEWAKQHLPYGPKIVAALTPVGSVPLNPLARELLIFCVGDEDVANILYATLRTGMWSGPTSDYYQSRLDVAREWLKDPHPAVRQWAQIEVNSLERQLAQAKLEEVEAIA